MSRTEYLDPYRTKVAAIQHRLNAAIDDIRANPNYSDDGRRTEIRAAFEAAQKEAHALRTKVAAQRVSRKEALQRDLFGVPAGADTSMVMSYRDAAARVRAQLNDAGPVQGKAPARQLLEDARLSGDILMARAVSKTAFERGWQDIVDDWADTVGSYTRGQVDELSSIPFGPNTESTEAMVFRIHAPREVTI